MKQFKYLLSMAAERNNVELIIERDLFPDPFRSALMDRGVGDGKDLLDKKFSIENCSCLGAVGGVNTGDSLCAVKKLVFDEKNTPWLSCWPHWTQTGWATKKCAGTF